MAYFKQGGDKRGGGPRFGGDNSRRPGFAKKTWGNDRGGNRPMKLHKATCDNCGRDCEVPFRPVAGKPVYCKDCFGKKEGQGDRFPRREFQGNTHQTRTSFQPQGGTDDVKRELSALNAKIDRLIQAVETIAYPKKAEPSLKEIVDDVSASKKAKKPAAKNKK